MIKLELGQSYETTTRRCGNQSISTSAGPVGHRPRSRGMASVAGMACPQSRLKSFGPSEASARARAAA